MNDLFALALMVPYLFLSIVFVRDYFHLVTRLAVRSIRLTEDQLVPEEEALQIEGRQVMTNRLIGLYKGPYGDYLRRIPYYRLCAASLLTLLTLLAMLLLMHDSIVVEPTWLLVILIMPFFIMASAIIGSIQMWKSIRIIQDGSWFCGKAKLDIYLQLSEAIKGWNELVNVKKKRTSPRPGS